MSRLDFTPFYRSTVGFDRLFSRLDDFVAEGAKTYPPYNIERTGEDAYRVTVAVAGFAAGDLSIETKENGLVIKGGRSERDENREFLHRGIAERAFELRFQLADHVEVSGANLENGLLHVELKRELPESKRPRQIAIGTSGTAATIEDKTVN